VALNTGRAIYSGLRKYRGSRVNKRPRLSSGTRFKAGRSRTTVNRRRKRSGTLFSNNEDLQQSSRSRGRRMRFTNRFTRRFVSKTVENQIYSLRQTSNYGGTSGPLLLPNWQPGAGQGPKRAPCVLIDLSGVRNAQDLGGGTSIITPQTTWNLEFSDETDTALAAWRPAGAGWQLTAENTSSGSAAIVGKPCRQDYLKWVRCDFLFYHPLTVATKVNIQLVQFMDRRLVPNNTVYPGLYETMDVFSTAFWQSQVKGYMHNPIDPTNSTSYGRYIKVLQSETFVLNPKESTEATNTRYKITKMFRHLNRSQKYDWDQTDRMNMDDGNVQVNEGAMNVTPQPKARVYLLIRALAPEYESATYPPEGWENVWPSADMYIRTCHTSIV